MAEHSVVLGAIAQTPASKTSLWLQGIPIMLRIDAHRKGYATPDMHDIISSSIHSATTKNIVRFVLGCCIFLRTPLRAVRFKPIVLTKCVLDCSILFGWCSRNGN